MTRTLLPFGKLWRFVPRQSIGLINFGQSLTDLWEILQLEPEGDLGHQLYQFYKSAGFEIRQTEMFELLKDEDISFRSKLFDLSVTFDKEFKVSAVHTRHSCFYHGKELIGAHVHILKALINFEPEVEAHAFGHLLTYDQLDFHAYVENHKILSVIAARYPND